MATYTFIYYVDLKTCGDKLERKFHRPGEAPGEPITRVRTPNKKEGEILGTVQSMLGANRVVVRCADGVTRMCRIPGKIKKRIWIREGDTVIVVPWAFQNDKADVIWRYTQPQVDWLQKKGYL